MMKNTLLFALLILVNISCFGQKAVSNTASEIKLFKSYDNYFSKDHEWVYTHLNKSAYFQGDDIWFTSYIINPANKLLNIATTKLYVELWSQEKKLISRKILFVKVGTASHYIHLTDSLVPGTYCFRAYTNWMLNFYDENEYNTLIAIKGSGKTLENGLKHSYTSASVNLANPKDKKTTLAANPIDYDIQFLPESGLFLEGTDNVFGVKAIDSYGRAVKIEGKISTTDNQEITTFTTNELGMTNVTIPESTNHQYIATVTLPDGTNRDIKLVKTEPLGVIIHINPYRPDVVWFKIQTNETTLRLNKSYIFMIHSNGVKFKNYRINFSKSPAIQFRIKREELGSGLLSATIFDENLIPVAERLFYNQDTTRREKLAINASALANDTVKLNVSIPDSLYKAKFAKLSISVLPEATVLNLFTNSLLAESIFHPTIKGNIENPNYYFEKNDIEHTMAIDNLLLTQGWRKYDWPTILKDTIHHFQFPFEEGFAIEGKVKNWLKNKPELKSKITVFSPQNKIYIWAPVDSVGEFKFDRVYLTDSTSVIISASSDKGKKWNRILLMNIPETILDQPNFKPILTPPGTKQEIADDVPKLTKGVIRLKEVVISGKKKNLFADNVYIGMMSKTLEITKENYNQYNDLELLLQAYFNIRVEHTDNGGYRFDMGRGNKGQPTLMIDGMKVNDSQDIFNYPMNMIEAVAVNKDGFGGGMGGAHGTIAIKTRSTPLFDNLVDDTNMKRLTIHGYATPKKYFEPKYLIQPGTMNYDKYATIYWEPNLIIDPSKKASLHFYVPNELKALSLRVEGISLDGKIFLHEQKIALPGRN